MLENRKLHKTTLKVDIPDFKPLLITAEQKLARNVLSMIFQDEFNKAICNRWSEQHIKEVICDIAGIEYEVFIKHFNIFKNEVIFNKKDPKVLVKIINCNFLNITKHNSTNATHSLKKKIKKNA